MMLGPDEDVADMVSRLCGPMVVRTLNPHARQGRAGADDLCAARLDDAFEGRLSPSTPRVLKAVPAVLKLAAAAPPPCHSTR